RVWRLDVGHRSAAARSGIVDRGARDAPRPEGRAGGAADVAVDVGGPEPEGGVTMLRRRPTTPDVLTEAEAVSVFQWSIGPGLPGLEHPLGEAHYATEAAAPGGGGWGPP